MLLKRREKMRPGWHPDPTGRHQYREWNGLRWTEHVSDHGRPAVDWVRSRRVPHRRSRVRTVGAR